MYTMPAPEVERVFTYRDYVEWGEDVRCELINGVVYDMAPAPSRIHQEILTELLVQIRNQLDRKTGCRVYVAPFDVRLPDADEADDDVSTVVQPDISVICDPSKLDGKGCRGAPDWIIEIISPSTASMDYIRKLTLYESRGVREYWIVHPVDKIIMVFSMTQEGRYGKPEIYSVENRVKSKVIEGLEMELREVFEP
jgi:Uma2 family endonuclease